MPIIIKLDVRTDFSEDHIFLRTAYIDVFHVADGCADVDILIHRQHTLNRGKMSAAAANAPCVVVQVASAAAHIDFGRQGFIVEEDFAAGYFGIPDAAVGRERTKFTDTRFNIVLYKVPSAYSLLTGTS